MHSQGKDEPNAPGSQPGAGRSPCYQTIAKLAETTKNYLAQPGVELRSPNTSSDLLASCQDPDKKALQTSQEAQPLPPDSNQEIERELFISTAALTGLPAQADREEELTVGALNQSQPKVDSDSFQTAPAYENAFGQLEAKKQQTLTTTIQSLHSTAEVGDKNVVTAAFTAVPPSSNAAVETGQAWVCGAEAHAMQANLTSSPTVHDKVEKSKEDDAAQICDEEATILQKNHLDDHPISTEAIQRQTLESQADQKPLEESPKPAQQAEAPPSGRAIRSCVKNTPNYSHTHKGITTSQLTKNVTPFEAVAKDQQMKVDSKEYEAPAVNLQVVIKEERRVSGGDNKNKLAGRRTYEEICRSYENMFAFDWDLRDINNMRHPPDREVTPIVVWFYINILYFPYNAQELAKVPYEEFARPILERLARIQLSYDDEVGADDQDAQLAQWGARSGNDHSLAASQEAAEEQDIVVPAMSQASMAIRAGEGPAASHQRALASFTNDSDLPELIQKLQIEDHFKEFRDLFQERMGEIQQRFSRKEEADGDAEMDEEQEVDAPECLLPENQEERDDSLFEMLESRLQDCLDDLSTHNKNELEKQYTRFTEAYITAEDKATLIIDGASEEVPRPSYAYNPTRLKDYGLDFLSYVDPYFVADIRENKEWYLQNQNEVLLNVSYPSKQEKEFLRHIEQWQQEKNDLNYKRILQQLAEGADDPNSQGPNGLNIQRYNSLSAHKRGLVVQEDAQCAICNNGDYEDEDLIVFCGACNIPVHQRCYGIDEIPDNDWICNNCWAFNMRRGIMVKCILCPKRGGAMKPTSIFRTHEQFMRYHQAALKKKGLHHLNYFVNTPRLSQDDNAAQEAVLPTDHALENQNQNSQSIELKREVQPEEPAQQPTPLATLQQTPSAALALQLGKQSSSHRSQRLHFFEREDKNHALSQILNREGGYQEHLATQKRENGENFSQNAVELHFLESESIAEIPEDYTFFLQRNELRLECPETVPTDTLYEWVHLSCAMWIPGPTVTPKTPVRMSRIDIKRFDLQCIICGKRNGACIQCQHSRCMISFHIECARRANYFLEVERVDRERNYRVFCEKHRPLKIVREMEEKDKQTLEEVQKFSKLIDRCMETYTRAEIKQIRQKRIQPFSKPPAPQQPSKREILAEQRQQKLDLQKKKKQERDDEIQAKKEQLRVKKEQERKDRETQKKLKQEQAQIEALKRAEKQAKEKQQKSSSTSRPVEPIAQAVVRWRDKDRKLLYERIRDRFLQLMKLRINVQKIDPMVRIKKKQEILAKKNEKEQRRIEKKRREKQIKKVAIQQAKKLQQSGQRSGLRSRQSTIGVNEAAFGAEPDLNASALADMSSSQVHPMTADANMAMIQGNDQNLEGGSPRHQDDFMRSGDLQHQDGANKDESDSEQLQPERRPTVEELVMPENTDPYYKFVTPIYVQELDWAVTFSKYDFPWHEIKFDFFSAKECYKKYTKEIRDAQTFFKKILGGKDKYKKNIAGQLEDAQQIFFNAVPEETVKGAEGKAAEKDNKVVDEAHESEDIEHFCKCRGEFNSLTGYFVMCENESACPNGGWLHPECTKDLFKMTQEQIGKIDKWYCEDCIDRIKNEPIKRQKTSAKGSVGARENARKSKKKQSKKRSKTPSVTVQNTCEKPATQSAILPIFTTQSQHQPSAATKLGPLPSAFALQNQASAQNHQIPLLSSPSQLHSHSLPQLQQNNHQQKPFTLPQTLPLPSLPLNSHQQPPKAAHQTLQQHSTLSSTLQSAHLQLQNSLPYQGQLPSDPQPALQHQSKQAQQSQQHQVQTHQHQAQSAASFLQVNHAFHQLQQQKQQSQQQSQTSLTGQQAKGSSAGQSLVSLLAQQRPKEQQLGGAQRLTGGPGGQSTLSQQLASLAQDIQRNSVASQQLGVGSTQLPQISTLTVPHQLQRQQQSSQSPAAQFSLSPRLPTHLQQSQLSSQLPLLLSQPQANSAARQTAESNPLIQQNNGMTQPQQQQLPSSKVILNFGSKLSSLPKFQSNNTQPGSSGTPNQNIPK